MNAPSESTLASSKATWEQWIEKLDLQEHPEGGFFAETYRSSVQVATPRGERSASTAIYYLLTPDSVSRLHRIQSDECWHFYAGGPLTVVELVATKEPARITRIGIEPGCVPQHIVSAGTWFGSFTDSDYSLVGCTVAPGFDFNDFEFASQAKLLQEFPLAKDFILKLTQGLP